jgi:hypothetical protein
MKKYKLREKNNKIRKVRKMVVQDILDLPKNYKILLMPKVKVKQLDGFTTLHSF